MKKLQERLKAGIDFNPKKDPCYDSIVEEAETILGHVLDAAEGKEVPYKNFTVGGGYDERKDREIVIVNCMFNYRAVLYIHCLKVRLLLHC